jgi:dihydropteroate synthase
MKQGRFTDERGSMKGRLELRQRTKGIGLTRAATIWKLRTRTLELGRRTLVMGVVNVTPDSFSRDFFLVSDEAITHAVSLLDDGADIVDLGAESTRPGVNVGGAAVGRAGASAAPAVSAEEEQARLLPVLEGVLRARPGAIVSVDTYKAETARVAIAAGAEIVNDVSGFSWGSGMDAVAAATQCGVVLTHTRGRPDEWAAQAQLEPDELMRTVRIGLEASLAKAAEAGIEAESIVLDPGYGFGKRGAENFALLARQTELLGLGRPLLAGVSRKSFLGQALAPRYGGAAAPVGARETASVAGMVAAILAGASIVRVHRMREAVEAALVADAVLGSR